MTRLPPPPTEPSRTGTGDSESLEATFDAAVGSTRDEANRQLARLDALALRWEQRLLAIDTSEVNLASEGGSPSEILAGDCKELRERFEARAQHLDRISLVLFGCTGAGKSSLVEALSRGDGTRVSPDGRLDHTREIAVVRWEGCDLVDTPGIEGWAEAAERELIEREAHEALKRADLVILTFHDYNQKVGEFRQIARWVADEGKAAIAVLNVRDDSWRFDARLWEPSGRETSAAQVRSHAKHIENLLAQIGLPDVPIIAINTLWAFGGRTGDPSAHPAGDELADVLAGTTRPQLEHISNIDAMVDLTREVLSTDPIGFRLGALEVEQATGWRRLSARLLEAATRLELLASQRERRVESVVQRAGFMPTRAPSDAPDDSREHVALFAEALRLVAAEGGAEIRPGRGEVLKWTKEHVQDVLLAERSKAAKRVSDTLSAAASRGRSLSSEDLQSAAIGDNAFVKAASKATRDVLKELEQQLKSDAEDLELEFALELDELDQEPDESPPGFDHSHGRGQQWVGRGLGFGGTLSGGAGVVLIVSLSNPVGWALVGVGLGTQILGRWLRKNAEKKRRTERLRAERDALGWLDRHIADLEAGTEALVAWHGTVRTAAFFPLVRDATRLRELATTTRRASRAILRQACQASNHRPAQELLASAASTIETRRHGRNPRRHRLTWLGEDWLDEPYTESIVAPRPLSRERLGDKVSLKVPRGARVDEWWASAEALAQEDDEFNAALARGRAVRTQRPVVGFLGDYSAGKTSLVCRLAVESGVGNDRRALGIDAAPTTTTATRVELPAVTLCDTPGLQSEHGEHEAISEDAIAGAAVIVAVHTPAAGTLDTMVRVLSPGGAHTRMGRTIHVLARVDDLTPRPLHDPHTFLRLLEAKRAELRRRVRARGLRCTGDQPLPVAADPGRRHALNMTWTAVDFDAHRSWTEPTISWT